MNHILISDAFFRCVLSCWSDVVACSHVDANLMSLDITGQQNYLLQDDSLRTAPVPLLPTVFTPGVMTYNISLPFLYQSLMLKATWRNPDTVSAGFDRHNASGQASVVSLLNATQSTYQALGVGINTITIASSLDGNYTITVIRLAPDLQAFAMYQYSCISNNALIVNPIVALPITPAFAAGVTEYTMTVPSSYDLISFSAYFTSVLTAPGPTYSFSQITRSGTLKATANIRSTISKTATTNSIQGSGCARMVSLDPGYNKIVLNTTLDGFYTIYVTRRPASWDLTGAQTELYSTQNSGIMVLTPRMIAGYTGFQRNGVDTPYVTVSVTVAGTENFQLMLLHGHATPQQVNATINSVNSLGVVTYSSSSNYFGTFDAWTFYFIAPTYQPATADPGQPMTVSFTVVSAIPTTVSQFDPLINYNITIKRQSIMSWVDTIPSYMFADVPLTFRLWPDESPKVGQYANVTVTATYGTVDAPVLYFTPWSSGDLFRSFTYTAPNSTAILTSSAPLWTAVTLSLGLSGPDAAHFILPSSVKLTVIPRAQFVYTGFPNDLVVYSSQPVTGLTISTTSNTFSNVRLNVSWTFDSNNATVYTDIVKNLGDNNGQTYVADLNWPSFGSFLWTSTHAFDDPLNYAPHGICDPTSADYDDFTARQLCVYPLSYNWQLKLPSVATSDIMTLWFTVEGSDKDHFIVPAPIRLSVSKQAYVVATNVPSTVVAGASFKFQVYLTTPPYNGGSVDFFPAPTSAVNSPGTWGACNPRFTPTNWMIPQECNFTAPDQAQVLNFTMKVNAASELSWQYMFNNIQLTVLSFTPKVITPTTLPQWVYANQRISTASNGGIGSVVATLSGFPPLTPVDILMNYTTTHTNPAYKPTDPFPIDFNLSPSLFESYTFLAPSDIPSTPPSSVPQGAPSSSAMGQMTLGYSLKGSQASMIAPFAVPLFNMTVVEQAKLTFSNIPAFLYQGQSSTDITITLTQPVQGCQAWAVNGQLGGGVSVTCPTTPSLNSGQSTSLFCCLCNSGSGACMRMALLPAVGDSPTPGGVRWTGGPTEIVNNYVWSTWAKTTDNTRTFQYDAPDTVGTAVIGVNLHGDSAHYNVQPSLIQIPIRPRGLFTITGVVGTVSINSVTTITVSINQQPINNGSVLLSTMLTGGALSGVASPAVLIFDASNWQTPQTFQFIAPSLAATLTLAYTVDGRADGVANVNNKNQWRVPASSTIIVQGTFAIFNAPSYLYENHYWPGVTIQALGKLNPNLRFTATIFPSGSGSTRLSSTVLDFSGNGNATFAISGPVSALDASNQLVAVSVTFTASGSDAAFFPIATISTTIDFKINILRQGQLKVVNNPASLMVLKMAAPQMKVVSDINFPVLDPTSSVAKAMGITTGITVIPFISSTTCATCEMDGVLPSTQLVWQPTLIGQQVISPKDTDQGFMFTAPQQAMTVTIGFKFDTSAGSNIYQYKLPPVISIVINPLGSWQVLAPPFVYAGSKTSFTFQPSIVPPGETFLQLSTCSNINVCGSIKDVNGVMSPIFQFIAPSDGSAPAAQRVTFEAPNVVTATTVLLSFSARGSDDLSVMYLPPPSPVPIIVSPLGKWSVSNVPVSVNAGSSFTITVTPTEILTTTVLLTVFAPNNAGGLQPVTLTFPAGSNSLQRAVVIAPSTAALLTLAFNSSSSSYPPPGITGTYVVGTVAIAGVPISMYSNQTTVNDISVTPMADLSSANGLAVTVRVTAGSVQPVSLAFSSRDPQYFIMASPVVNAAPLYVTLSFLLSDGAAVQFAPIPSYRILVLPQASFTITNLSTTSLYSYETVTFTVALTAPPDQGENYQGMSALVLCMGIWTPSNNAMQGNLTSSDFDTKLGLTGATRYCIGDHTSSLITVDKVISALSWPYASNQAPAVFRFTYQAPLEASSLQIRFQSQGPDMRHFMNPPAINITLLGPRPSDSSTGGAVDASTGFPSSVASTGAGATAGTSANAGLVGGSTGRNTDSMLNTATLTNQPTLLLGVFLMMATAAMARNLF